MGDKQKKKECRIRYEIVVPQVDERAGEMGMNKLASLMREDMSLKQIEKKTEKRLSSLGFHSGFIVHKSHRPQ
jgi:hypothetical protein